MSEEEKALLKNLLLIALFGAALLSFLGWANRLDDERRQITESERTVIHSEDVDVQPEEGTLAMSGNSFYALSNYIAWIPAEAEILIVSCQSFSGKFLEEIPVKWDDRGFIMAGCRPEGLEVLATQ